MITAIVVAAGVGKRMKRPENKAFLPLAGKPLLTWTLETIAESKIDNIIIAVQPKEANKITDLVKEYGIKKVIAIAHGGQTRQDSVSNALEFLPEETKIVAVHDGARPLIKPQQINKILDSLGGVDGVVPAVTPTDTIKQSVNDFIEKTPNRQDLKAAQTPQVFQKKALLESYQKAKEEGFCGTDDASVLEKYGYKVKITEGSYSNIKITTPVDLALAEILLNENRNRF